MKRGFRGQVAVAVVPAASGCTADELPARPAGARVAPTERACPHGTFRWGRVEKREVLATYGDLVKCGIDEKLGPASAEAERLVYRPGSVARSADSRR